jgi:cytosine/adenosine deaminase-related metal-dependent hydrolase
MRQFLSQWLLPVSGPPIRHAWLRIDRGRIVAYGDARSRMSAADEIDLGSVAVMPGVVNAHTHLELSWMRGRVAEADDFSEWIRAVLALRRAGEQDADIVRQAGNAIEEARRYGTALVGDISNTQMTAPLLAEHRMPGAVFFELLGFKAVDAESRMETALSYLDRPADSADVRHSLAAHAPYSVSPALFKAIRRALKGRAALRASVHLGESLAEVEFLLRGTGPWRQLLEDLMAWDDAWAVPKCDPVEYIDRMGFLDERLLVVHGVQLAPRELARVAAKGATLVTCPRGNIRTGAGVPPITAFYEAGVRVAVGTDSLASVPDLNVFAELAEMRKLAPDVPARHFVESATAAGARALGFEREFGTIDPGKRDALLVVDVDASVTDVEEYIVSGIDPAQVRWLQSP